MKAALKIACNQHNNISLRLPRTLRFALQLALFSELLG